MVDRKESDAESREPQRSTVVSRARVVVSGRDKARGTVVINEIDLDGTPAASKRLAEEASEVLGDTPDILVNNAGIYPGASTAETNEATFDRVYAVNVKAPYFLTAVIAPAKAKRGGGAIINLGSSIARLGIPVGSLCSSTKGALETLTRAWAAEYGPAGSEAAVNARPRSVGFVRPAPPEVSAAVRASSLGRPVSTLAMTDNPDVVVDHVPERCADCGGNLCDGPLSGVARRQVIDRPQVTPTVTEHRAQTCVCGCCGAAITANFPAWVRAPISWGPRVWAVVAYLLARQHIPVERAGEAIRDLFGVKISLAG